ncbi:MAG TPA: sulfur oxidation c-type cytochrome SoxX [Burkholderiales bacterium]|nr:sulfur oxidation c-type cytochrome SoxX [Burkholderiales bacterium]
MSAAAQGLVAFVVVGDGIPAPLTRAPGDAVRGRQIALDRSLGGCVLCHAVPDPAERFMGDIAPSLAGTGARLTQAQLRLRVVDSTRLNPATLMPAYYRTEGLNQVAAVYRGQPVLSAQQVEDVVAWLATLREPTR